MFLVSLLLAPSAEAADPTPAETEVPAGRPIKYLEREEIHFDGVDVTGETIKPGVTLIDERSPIRFHPMISLRRDWNDEMKASIASVQ